MGKPKLPDYYLLNGAWRVMGVIEEAYVWMEELKAQGVSGPNRWFAAEERWPPTAEAKAAVKKLRRNKAPKLVPPGVAEIQGMANKIREEKEAMRSSEMGQCTGLPLLDWVLGNLGLQVPKTQEPFAGALDLWEWAREHRSEFLNKWYLPALMKKANIGGPVPQPIEEQFESTTNRLLKQIKGEQ